MPELAERVSPTATPSNLPFQFKGRLSKTSRVARQGVWRLGRSPTAPDPDKLAANEPERQPVDAEESTTFVLAQVQLEKTQNDVPPFKLAHDLMAIGN